MSYEDIRNHMQEMYGVEVSAGLLSKITDKLLPIITQWRNRPLESIYTIVFLDAMFFKARIDGKVVTKTVYNILGINQQGLKDILGFYIGEAEGAHFWFGVLNDIKARVKYKWIKVLPPIGKQKNYHDMILTVIHAQERTILTNR